MHPRARSIRALVLASAFMFGWAPAPSRAQSPDTEGVDNAPAHIRVIEGSASLERDGQLDRSPRNVPLMAGDRLRTDEGRVEILFGDGSVLDIDHFSVLDLQSDVLMRLLEGRVRLTVVGGAPLRYRVDTPSASVVIDQPGDYRISLLSPAADRLDVELVVLRGSAELANEAGTTLVQAGERALTSGRGAPGPAQPHNVAYWDAFERWVEDQRGTRIGVTSSQYLPPDLQPYGGTFDQYGSWYTHATYGYVWCPRVSVGWRPYYGGRWNYYRPYGWTWIGFEPWSWPTHHYGRWGFHLGVWYWIPTRRWGPAWVSWGRAPGFVGWCPRGWDGRPVIGFGLNTIHGVDPWRAWTVVPHRSFVPGIAVGRHALSATAIPRTAGFVTTADAPVRADRLGVAVPRGVPLGSLGRDRAVPRGMPLPGTVPSMPATSLPSDTGIPARRGGRSGLDAGEVYRTRPGAETGALPRPGLPDDSRRPSRVRDAGVGGPIRGTDAASPPPTFDRPRAVPRGGMPERVDPGIPRAMPPGYVAPYERAVPRERGAPLPGSVPPMPATRLPSDVDRGYSRGSRGAPPPPPQAAPSSAPSAPSPPPPSMRSAPPSGSPSPQGGERAVPRHGGQEGRSGGSGGGAPSRRRPD